MPKDGKPCPPSCSCTGSGSKPPCGGIARRLAAVRFDAVAGAKYRVSSKLSLSANSREIFALGWVRCTHDDTTDALESLGHGENMLARQRTFRLHPRFVLAPVESRPTTCHLWVKPQTHDRSGELSRYTVDSTSWLRVGALHSSALDVRTTRDFVLAPGMAADVAVADNVTLTRSDATISVTGDALMTTCHGTFDKIVSCPSPAGMDNVTETEVRVYAFQRERGVSSGSDWCHTALIGEPKRRVIVGHSTHHGPIYAGSTFTGRLRCGTSVRIKVYVRNTGRGWGTIEKASAHKGTSILAVLPPAN